MLPFSSSNVRKHKKLTRASKAQTQRTRPISLECLEPRMLLSVYQPTSFSDGLTGNTLRGAIIAANAHPGADTIILKAGTYTLSIANDLTIDNGIENQCLRGDLDVTDTLTIQGAGKYSTYINAAQLDRVFQNFASLTLVNLTVTGGYTSNVYEPGGGGILSSAELTLINGAVSNNKADDDYTNTREGGGIYTAAPITLTDTVVNNNYAENGYGNGGGIRSTYSSTAQTNTVSGGMIADNHGIGGGINISGLWTIDGVTFSGNISTGAGGAILGNATTTRSTFSDNKAVVGGAISGGGLISDSTFKNNEAIGTVGVTNGGGAIYGSVNILDSTFYGNTAPYGGAIFGYGTLNGCTVSGNTATTAGGDLYADGFLTLKNTIVANGTAPTGADVSGNFITQGHNLIGNGDGSTGFVDGVMGDQVGTTATPVDPQLGALTNNGGPTETMALASTSPAVDAGDDSDAPATDQRGVDRIIAGHGVVPIIDIGAFEYDPATNPVPVISGVSVTDVSGSPTLLSTVALKITWDVTTGPALTSQTLIIDGREYTPITESQTIPGQFTCLIGQWKAGVHTYSIESVNDHGASQTAYGSFTVVNPPAPVISKVVVAESQPPKNYILESDDNLVVTWQATCTLPIVMQDLRVDGYSYTPINGPFSGLFYSCQLGKRPVGTHTLQISSTDSLGDTTYFNTTFTVVAPTPPSITSVVVAQKNSSSTTLRPGTTLWITWSATSTRGIASQSLIVDGRSKTPIKGPFSGRFYSCTIGAYSAGTHTYKITTTDAKGVKATHSGSFIVSVSSARSLRNAVAALDAQRAGLLASVMNEMTAARSKKSADDLFAVL